MDALSQITEMALSSLRQAVEAALGARRFLHTLGVEKEIERLAKLYLPQDILRLRASALLHDITKEYTAEQQIALLAQHGGSLSAADRLSPKILHARTAVFVIQSKYPAFADPIILDAIEKHTTGARQMSLFAKLLYLADYIEETRTFPECVQLRHEFWDRLPSLQPKQYISHLNGVLLRSYDMTIRALIEEGGIISTATIEARNSLIEEFNR